MWILTKDDDRIINSKYIIQSYIEFDNESDKYLVKAELIDGSRKILGSYYCKRDAWKKFLRIAKGEGEKDISERENKIALDRFIHCLAEWFSTPSKIGKWLLKS